MLVVMMMDSIYGDWDAFDWNEEGENENEEDEDHYMNIDRSIDRWLHIVDVSYHDTTINIMGNIDMNRYERKFHSWKTYKTWTFKIVLDRIEQLVSHIC